MTTESLYFSETSLRCGMLMRHGPHQVAQNSTTYTLPGSNHFGSVPRTNFSIIGLGAALPMVIGSGAASAFGVSCAVTAAVQMRANAAACAERQENDESVLCMMLTCMSGMVAPSDAIEWGEDTTPAPDAPRLWGSRRILPPLSEHARESPLHRTLQRHVERPRQHRRRPDHRWEGTF